MKSAKEKSIIILFVLLFSIFWYSQYASTSEISVSISKNAIINEDKNN